MIHLNLDELKIRPILVDDALAIKSVRDECLEYIHDSRSYTLEETIEWILFADSKYLTILQDNVVIGYFRLSYVLNVGCFVGMDLAKEHRGRGIAVKVYTLVLNQLVKYGIRQFYLRVLKSNTHAIRLYEYLGFKEMIKTDKDIIMVKQV